MYCYNTICVLHYPSKAKQSKRRELAASNSNRKGVYPICRPFASWFPHCPKNVGPHSTPHAAPLPILSRRYGDRTYSDTSPGRVLTQSKLAFTLVLPELSSTELGLALVLYMRAYVIPSFCMLGNLTSTFSREFGRVGNWPSSL